MTEVMKEGRQKGSQKEKKGELKGGSSKVERKM